MTNENKTELKNCPCCGSSDIDPSGTLNGDGTRSPECMDCGLVALTIETWNTRPKASEGVDLEMVYNKLALAHDTESWNMVALAMADLSGSKTQPDPRVKEAAEMVEGMIQQHNVLLNPIPGAIMAIKNVVEELTKIKTTLEG